jgi:LysM repeat protein
MKTFAPFLFLLVLLYLWAQSPAWAQPLAGLPVSSQGPPFGLGTHTPAEVVRLRANLDTAQGRSRVDLLNQLALLTDSLPQALANAREALPLAQSLGYPSGEAVARFRLGDASLWRRHVVGPTDSLAGIANQYGVAPPDVLGWNDLLGNALFAGQRLWLRQGAQPAAEALAHYQQALAVRQAQGQPDAVVEAWRKLGDFYLQGRDWAQAEAQYLQWANVREREGNPEKLAAAWQFLRQFYVATSQWPKAANAWRRRLAALAPGDPAISVPALREAAGFFASQGQWPESEQLLATAYERASTPDLAQLRPSLATDLYQLYARQWQAAPDLATQAGLLPKLHAWAKLAGADVTKLLVQAAAQAEPASGYALYCTFLALRTRVAGRDSLGTRQLLPLLAKYSTLPPTTLAESAPNLRRRHLAGPGDNVYNVATRYRVSISDLKRWNQLGPNETAFAPGRGVWVAAPPPDDEATADTASVAPPPATPSIGPGALADTLAQLAQQPLANEVAHALWLAGARSHARAGEWAKANAALEQALKKLPCPNCLPAEQVRNLMAGNELAAKRYGQALALYRQGLQVYQTQQQWSAVLPQLGLIGQVYAAWGKTAELEQHTLEVEALCRKLNLDLPGDQALALALLYEKRGQKQQAIDYGNKSFRAFGRAQPSDEAATPGGQRQPFRFGDPLPGQDGPALTTTGRAGLAEAEALLRRLVPPIGPDDPDDPEYVVHTTFEGETLASLGQLYDVPEECLYGWNFIPSPILAPGSRLRVCRRADWQRELSASQSLPGNQPVYHQAKAGESLNTLAQTFGVALAQLQQWNLEALPDPNYLAAGTRVVVGWQFRQCGCGK